MVYVTVANLAYVPCTVRHCVCVCVAVVNHHANTLFSWHYSSYSNVVCVYVITVPCVVLYMKCMCVCSCVVLYMKCMCVYVCVPTVTLLYLLCLHETLLNNS